MVVCVAGVVQLCRAVIVVIVVALTGSLFKVQAAGR
jgi:hypothetical protein